MKVTATHKGFFGHFREVGATFEIPDEPSRKITGADDAATEAIAVKKGKDGLFVPCAFASSWMQAGWADVEPFTPGVTDLGKMHASGQNVKADLNESKI